VPLEDKSTIPGDIENAYIISIGKSAEAMRYLHRPRGNIKSQTLNFSIPFFELYQHTHSLPSVAQQLNSQSGKERAEELREWFYSNHHSPEKLRQGLELFNWYQKILIDSMVIRIEK